MRDGRTDWLDGPSWLAFEGQRWRRYEHEPPLVSGGVLAIALAAILLVSIGAADVGLAFSPAVKVTITQVNWFVGNLSVGNQSGFTMAGGHSVSLGLVCEIFCPKFEGATVSSPFTLVNVTIAYPWNEYVNVTIRAPSTSYNGPLSVVLSWAPV